MRRKHSRLACIIGLFLWSALGADDFYLGTWKIASATIAPWWADKANAPDPAERNTLLGNLLVIKPNGIDGPRQVVCRTAKYKVVDYPADMLFQGMFGEMHQRNKTVEPAKVAAQVGFRGSKWKTLETGCGNELDYHFLDPSTTSFGLNNYIYILKKQ